MQSEEIALQGSEVFALICAVAVVLLIGPYSYYSSAGFIDPWLPLAYFLNFEDLLARFGPTYYVGRLPYTIPGLIAYGIFTPHVANFALNLFFLSLAVVSLYAIVALWAPRAAAAAVAMAFALNTYTASAFAWDYSDGPAIALCLSAIAVYQVPRKVPELRRLFYAGALFLMAGGTNLIVGLVVAPASFWVWISGPLGFRFLAQRGLALFGGVVVAFVILSVVSKGLIGTSRFIGMQVDQFRNAVDTPGYLDDMWGTGWLWIIDSPRLWTLFGMLGIGLLLVARSRAARRDRAVTTTLLFYVASAAAFLWVEFAMGAVVLRVSYHSSYLLLPLFLFVGAVFGWMYRNLPLYNSSTYPIAALLVIVVSWGIPLTQANIGHLSVTVGIAWAVVAGLAATTIWALITSRSILLVAPFLIASVGSAATFDRGLGYVFAENRRSFDVVVEASNVLRAVAPPGTPLRFWFDGDEPLGGLFHSIDALNLWDWRDLTRELAMNESDRESQGLRSPRMIGEAEMKRLFRTGTLIIHLTSDPAKIVIRDQLLRSRNVSAAWRRDWTAHLRGVKFHMIIMQTTALVDTNGRSAP